MDRGPHRRCRLLTWGPFVGVPLLTAAVLAVLATQPWLTVQRAVRDEGIVQQASAWLMLLALVPALYRFRFGWSLERLETALAVLVISLREWDWHKRFTAESVTSINYYLDPADPPGVRLLAAAAVVAVAAVGVHCLLTWLPRFLADLGALRPWAVNAVLWAVTMLAAALLDKLTRTRSYGNTIEEVMELSAGALLIYVVWLMPADPSPPPAAAASPDGPAPGPRDS
jgi:hypothetical protein